MFKTTLADLLSDQVDPPPGHVIYMVGDGETIFYIGQSLRHISDRLIQHLGLGDFFGQTASPLGRFIENNLPGARDWIVTLMTFTDCEPFVRQRCPYYKHWGVKQCEISLIKTFHPCLNVSHNDTPTPIPNQYLNPWADDPETEAAKRKAAELLHVPYPRRNLLLRG